MVSSYGEKAEIQRSFKICGKTSAQATVRNIIDALFQTFNYSQVKL